MFDLRRPVFVAVALIACASARTVSAQDLQKIGARVLAAHRAADAARDSAQAIVDSIRSAALPRDSIAAGGFIVRFAPGTLSSSTRAAIERGGSRAWARVQQALGDGAGHVGTRLPIIVAQQAAPIRIQRATVSFTLKGAASSGVWFPVPLSATQAEEGFIDLAGTIASLDEPNALKKFAGEWIPAVSLAPERWEESAVDLATADAAVARECWAGSIARCESALGLTDVKDPLTEWYSNSDLRVLVSRLPVPANEPADRKSMRLRCLTGAAPDMCALLEREHPTPRPVVLDSRRTLIGLALEVGGPKAYDRMLAASGTATDVLASTAGMSIDDLVTKWRVRTLAASPDRVRPHVFEATTLIAWTLIFAAFARRRPR